MMVEVECDTQHSASIFLCTLQTDITRGILTCKIPPFLFVRKVKKYDFTF